MNNTPKPIMDKEIEADLPKVLLPKGSYLKSKMLAVK